MGSLDLNTWSGNWAWGLPLIVLTVVMHVSGLAFINERMVRTSTGAGERRHLPPRFATVMSVITLQVTFLHAIESALWAAMYRILGALPDNKTAMLYSLSAMTTYGHASLFLKAHWQLMGALEALNGMLLFGLTTAFLFAMIQTARPLGQR
jgi:hypothetical protein